MTQSHTTKTTIRSVSPANQASGALIILLTLWIACFHWTGVHQIAISRNVFTGEVTVDSIAGFNFSLPWVQVSRIDIRPHRLCIDCDCRALNCRLIEFDKSGWLDFVNREGFRYYWWSNRFSYNNGAKQEYRGMAFILRGYMSDDQPHPFLKITKE
jgi:hypothetical protein